MSQDRNDSDTCAHSASKATAAPTIPPRVKEDGSAPDAAQRSLERSPRCDRGRLLDRAAVVIALILLGALAAWWLSPQSINPGTDGNTIGTRVRGRVAWVTHPPMIDVGGEGVLWKTQISIANPWKVPIQITRARSSCNCTVPEIPPQPIPPGGQVAVPVQVTVAQDGQAKPVRIDMETKTGHTLVHILNIVRYRSVVVQQWPRLSEGADDGATTSKRPLLQESNSRLNRIPLGGSDTLSFGEIPFGSARQEQWFIQVLYDRSAGDGPVEATLEIPQASLLQGELGPLERLEPIHDGRVGRYGARLTLRLSQSASTESGTTGLAIWVAVPGKPRQAVWLTALWRVKQVLEVEPASLLVEIAPDEHGPRQVPVRLRHVQGQPFQLLQAASEASWLRAAMDAGRTADEHEVTCTLDSSTIRDWATTTLQLKTNLVEQPQISIRVSVRRTGLSHGS